VAVWTGTAQYSQPVTIPAGTYKITVPIYNAVGGTSPIVKNLIGFIADNGTEYLATSKTYPVNEWYTETISLVLTEETTGIFTVGYTADNAGSGSMPHLFLDKFVLEEAEDVALLRDELEKAINEAQTTVDAGKAAGDGLFGYSDESNDELDQAIVNAQNVNDDADATADELQAAIDAIKDATDKYKDSINKPGDEEYVITQKASGLYLSVATDLVTISAEPCKLKFEETEGGWFITNGRAERITWRKENWSPDDPVEVTISSINLAFDVRQSDFNVTRYYDMNGNEIKLNQGKTFVEIVRNQDASKVVITDNPDVDTYIIDSL
jgi:hypothetical protein